MSIRKVVDWLFGLGDDGEPASRESFRSTDDRPKEVSEVRLYGEAEAIRVLYQTGVQSMTPPKPPRPRGRRDQWLARYLNSLSPALREPAGAKA